jgi:SAM-dependent methyltransferase
MKQQLPTCPVCDGGDVAPMPFGYDVGGKRLQAVGCRRCGVIVLHPLPSDEEIAALYTKEYFEGDFRCGHEGSCFTDPARAALAGAGLLERIRQMRPSGRFLEVGCAGGAFLNAARQAGYEVQGVELSREASQFARETFGLPVFTGHLPEAGFPADSFDIVYLGDVIEHLPRPRAILGEVLRVLSPGGVVMMACPSQTNTLFSRAGFAVYRLLARQATVQLPPYHLFEYRPRSIRFLLERCGFKQIQVRQYAMPPGTIALRGPAAQRIGKKFFQFPNYALTALFGAFGDRMEVTGIKPHD